jgi:hypothetical protein
MCTELEIRKDEKEETFEDFKRIILDGALNCEDDPNDL